MPRLSFFAAGCFLVGFVDILLPFLGLLLFPFCLLVFFSLLLGRFVFVALLFVGVG